MKYIFETDVDWWTAQRILGAIGQSYNHYKDGAGNRIIELY